MQKTYVIRKIAYHYSDEYLYVHTLGGIHEILHNEEEAMQLLAKLERDSWAQTSLGDIEPFSPCCSGDVDKLVAFRVYCQRKLGLDLVKVSEYGRLYCEYDTRLPTDLSDEIILDIRRISGVKFYDLSVYEGEPSFYGVWGTGQYGTPLGYVQYSEALYFHNTYVEALDWVKSQLSGILSHKEISGSLAELSNTPSFLRSLINSSERLMYDENKSVLTTRFLKDEEAVALQELLKEKVLEIKALDLGSVKDISHYQYEIM